MASAVVETQTQLPFAATTPISIARVGLKARDAEKLAEYYRSLLGFDEMGRSDNRISLGAGGRELLEIEGSAALKPDDPRTAGLFHTAFLLPTRAELARWTRHAMENRIAIDGASDHLVSEALYLTDPEGNGIEIYADRPKEAWSFAGGEVEMATNRLDFESLLSVLKDDEGGWAGAPSGTVVGHVHMRVGDVEAAESWWNETMSFDTMLHYGNAAVFLSSGGYHHHIGANAWQSRGAGPRPRDMAGLGFIELASGEATETTELVEPWGTPVRTVPA